MPSRYLVDPQLLPALEVMPSFEVTADTLNDIRSAIAQTKVPAPPAPETTVEERFIPGADGTSVRILVYTPKTHFRTGCLLWFHGGGMVMASPDGNEAQSRYLAQTAGCVVVAALQQDCRCERDRGEFSISAQFLLYPMLDDRTGTTSEPDPMPYAAEFVWTKASNHFAWGAVLGQEPGGSNVPIYAAPGRAQNLAGLPPTSIFIGDLDLFVGENFRARTNLNTGWSSNRVSHLSRCLSWIHFFRSGSRCFKESFPGLLECH